MPNRSHRPTTRRAFHAAALGAALAPLAAPARAAVGGLPTNVDHRDTSPPWEALRPKLVGARPVETANPKVRLEIPLRAAYGASVPVRIVSLLPQRPELFVRRMTLIVDKNPSPVVATLALTPRLGQADFDTRIRVDEYSHVRLLAELSDGSLHADSRYVKVSGGCSAPPNREFASRLGETVLKVASPVRRGVPNVADVTVLHPNDTGFELNNQTVMFIPPHFVRTIAVSYAGEKLFDADEDFGVSENPTWRFRFVPDAPGELRADVTDSKDGRFSARLAIARLDDAGPA